jgi:transcriptional regulator with XRE-family HTH domain
MFRLRVKQVIEARKISMSKLSRGADVPYNLIRRMVNDPNYIPSIPTLSKVARYLGVPMDDLWYDDEEEGNDAQ